MKHVTTAEAADLLDVPADRIARWKYDGKIVPVGILRGRGRGGQVPIYRLEELRPLAERYHATRRQRADE
ncbi:MAG TPA: hypothetical protein VNS46_06760 [Nocardioides sp.]|nr:hypothetical protein [Nocardioides sp.]